MIVENARMEDIYGRDFVAAEVGKDSYEALSPMLAYSS